MVGRRPHKKSRAGCRTCKKRRIKCDERHPKCNNCSSHGLTCDFTTLTILPSLSAESRTALMSLSASQQQMQRQTQSHSPSNISVISTYASSSPSSSPGTAEYDTQNSYLLSSFSHAQPSPTALIPQPQTSRTLESQLLYLWTTNTSKTLTVRSETGIDVWGIIVPTLGLNNARYLMNAIYAASALHLRYLTTDAEFEAVLARASHSYIVAAISEYRAILSSADSTTAGNAEALFVTSSLIAFYSTASRIFPPSEGEYEPPLEWFLSYQGIKTVVLSSWKYLRTSPRVLPIILSQPALSLDLNSSSSEGFFHSLLPASKPIESEEDRETENAYAHSIAFLNWAHHAPQRNKLMGFAATVSSHFITLLSARDPRTLVILACFFAMMKVVEHEVWWLVGTAQREVMGILNILPDDDEWRSKMAWAVTVVRSESPLRDERVWGCFVRERCEVVKEETDAEDVRPHIEYLVSMIPAD
ncbi:C6 zinc finger protein [Phlyctema vagabunda]|uniref:C6 zinc finger protein n=1 Tax=Phlyctema vagabunda TaxID=108571 RepID=A0ABR4PC94_9HELO